MISRKSLDFRSILLVLLVAATSFAQNVQVTDKAREHFKAGIAYMEEPTGAKYEEAYQEFQTAYAESPSYKILNNLAVCSLFLERDGEAIDFYDRYLAVAPKGEIPAQKRTQIDSDLKRLKAGVVRVTFKTTPAEVLLVDERATSQGNKVVNRYSAKNGELAIGLHPGSHRITAKADDFEPQTWEFEATPASQQTHEFKLQPTGNGASTDAAKPAEASSEKAHVTATEPPAPPRKGTPAGVYVGAVATGVFAVAATVTGLMALTKKNEVVDLNKSGNDADKAQSASDSGKTLALVCDIGIGAAVLAAGATTYFWLSAPKESQAVTTASRWKVAPVVTTHQAGLGVFGKF